MYYFKIHHTDSDKDIVLGSTRNWSQPSFISMCMSCNRIVYSNHDKEDKLEELSEYLCRKWAFIPTPQLTPVIPPDMLEYEIVMQNIGKDRVIFR